MKKIKEILRRIPILGTLSVTIYRRFSNRHSLSYWIGKYLPYDAATILQIGSNDGKTGDPLYILINERKKWKAIFVEPIPYLFERLKLNYGSNPRFVFENVAINDGSEQIFYSVKEEARDKLPDLPFWIDQLGSFYKESITKHFNGILEPFIEVNTLQGVTLANLISRNSIDFIDLLHIDAEGYDWKILGQLPLNEYKPTIILYEHKHLSTLEKRQSIEFLLNDYFVFDVGGDFLSIRRNVIKKSHLNKIGIEMITEPNKI